MECVTICLRSIRIATRNKFVGHHNFRSLDTINQMRLIARQLIGKRLKYKDLVG